MMAHTIYPAVLRNAVVLTLRGIPQSTHMPLIAASFYSTTSFHSLCVRSPRHLPAKKQQIQALKCQFSEQRYGSVECYCTSTKQGEPFGQIQPTSQSQNRLSAELEENMKSGNDEVIHVGEQSTEVHVNDSDKISRNFESMNEDEDEPIDRRALIELEVELLRQEAFNVPDRIIPSHWEELISMSTRNRRKTYLKFLFLNEKKKENDQKKKDLKRLEREKVPKKAMPSDRHIAEDGHIQYGLWCNTIFLRIHEATMNYFNNGRVMSAMMHGQPLVIDVGFDEHMTTKEQQNCASQLLTSFANNRSHADPFYMHFCNANKDGGTMQRLKRLAPVVYDPDFPLTVTPESYLDNFPKKKLVYLTPHCKEEITRFDHNAIYIIGGIVDLGSSEPLTLAKARREGIRMQKFPLERYLNWGMGTKSLTIDQVVNVMLDLKHTDDWYYSFRHIPRRKLRSSEDSQAQLQDYVKKNLRTNRAYSQTSRNRVKHFYGE